MEENKELEALDAFTKKYIKESEVEVPSIDFTKNIMDTILELEDKKKYQYTPLISKKIWFVLLGILGVSIAFVSKGTSIKELYQLEFLKVPNLNWQVPSLFEQVTISNTFLYAGFFFTLLMYVQIYLLKSRFESKL